MGHHGPLTAQEHAALHPPGVMAALSVPASALAAASPSNAALDQSMQQVFGPYHTPQTTAGRYAESVGSFLPNMAFGPESMGLKLLGAVAPGVASEAAGEATQGTKLEPWARAGAAIATGHLASLPFGPSGADKAMLAATKGMTQDQIDATQALRQTGAGVGVIPTIAEAGQAATGNGVPLLAKLQQLVEQKPSSGLNAALTARVPAARSAIADALDRIAPSTDQPSLVAQRAQDAAQGVLGGLTGERTALVTPYYRAAAPVTVDPDGMNGLMSQLDARIAADKTGVLSGPLGKVRDMLTDQDATATANKAAQAPPTNGSASQTVRDQVEQAWNQLTGDAAAPPATPNTAPARVPVLDIDNLDRARKFIRDQAATQVGRTLTPEQGAAMQGVSDHLDNLMSAASPDYVGGKANYAQFTTDNIDPVQAGPIGRIAATNQLGGQTRALFPTAPAPGQAAETGQAVDLLKGADYGDLAAALARAHLGQTADEALQDTRSGPNLYGPAQWATNIAGNSGQRDALTAGITSAAGPDVADHVNGLIDVLGATGRRLPASPSDVPAFSILQPSGASDPLETGIGLGVGKEAFGPGGMMLPLASKALGHTLGMINLARANAYASGLADALTAPADATASTILNPRAAQAQQAAMLSEAAANAATAQANSGSQP